MRKLVLALSALALMGFVTLPVAFADTTSLQSVLINVNGTQQTTFAGMNVLGFDQTTGLGTITFTYNPGPGTYFFDVFFDHQLSLPFYNEYGVVNGAPAAGQTYEIGDSFLSSIYPDVQAGGPLPNANNLPGTLSNFGNACVGAACNGDFASAMGFAFTLVAGQQELITLGVSHTDPGGFTLQDIHPQDAANPTPLTLFVNGSAVTQTTRIPEPGSGILLLSSASLALFFKMLRSKFSTT
jgi:hypothetical protein